MYFICKKINFETIQLNREKKYWLSLDAKIVFYIFLMFLTWTLNSLSSTWKE